MSEVFENATSTGQTTAIDFAIANFFGKTWTDFAIFGSVCLILRIASGYSRHIPMNVLAVQWMTFGSRRQLQT
jgi:hypothetical protein